MFGKTVLLVLVVVLLVTSAPLPDSHISKTLHPASGSAKNKGFVIEVNIVVKEERSQDRTTEGIVKTESVTEDKNESQEDKEEETKQERLLTYIAAATPEGNKKIDEEDKPYSRITPEDIKAKAGKSVKDHMKLEGDAIKPGKLTKDKSHTKDATTLDPLTEFCKEACAAGVGGPECDCPDHPIG